MRRGVLRAGLHVDGAGQRADVRRELVRRAVEHVVGAGERVRDRRAAAAAAAQRHLNLAPFPSGGAILRSCASRSSCSARWSFCSVTRISRRSRRSSSRNPRLACPRSSAPCRRSGAAARRSRSGRSPLGHASGVPAGERQRDRDLPALLVGQELCGIDVLVSASAEQPGRRQRAQHALRRPTRRRSARCECRRRGALPRSAPREDEPQQRRDGERRIDARDDRHRLRSDDQRHRVDHQQPLNQNISQRWRSASGSARSRYQALSRSKPVWNQAR